MSAPCRVLLMAGSLEGGGSELQTLLLLQHLDRKRFAPELYLTYRRGPLLSQVPSDVPVHAFDDTHRAARLWWPGREHRRRVKHLRDLLRTRKIDVIYDRTFHMTLIAGPAASDRVPRVSTIVSPPDRDLPHSEKRFLHWKKLQLARSYRQSRVVLAVSDAVRAAAIEYYRIAADQVVTLYSPITGIDVELLNLAQQRRDANDPCIRLICVGRMTTEKGQERLLEGVEVLRQQLGRNFPKLDLCFVGDGPQRTGLVERASRMVDGLLSIEFLGQQDRATVLRRIAVSDLLVSPSAHEGLPNVVLEACALGTPVLATDVGGTAEILTSVNDAGFSGLIDSNEPTIIAIGLKKFLSDRAGFVKVSEQRRLLVASRFGLNAYLAKIADILDVSTPIVPNRM